MKPKVKYYFNQFCEDRKFLAFNERYDFIWKDFDDEDLAWEAFVHLATMIQQQFGTINLELELLKKYVAISSEDN
jgi:hypothetical protein